MSFNLQISRVDCIILWNELQMQSDFGAHYTGTPCMVLNVDMPMMFQYMPIKRSLVFKCFRTFSTLILLIVRVCSEMCVQLGFERETFLAKFTGMHVLILFLDRRVS